MEERVENGYFLYRTAPWPCGREYMLLPTGPDLKTGKATFTAEEVYDGKLPYDNRDWKPIKDAIAPKGYKWYSNGKSRFNHRYEHALVREKAIYG